MMRQLCFGMDVKGEHVEMCQFSLILSATHNICQLTNQKGSLLAKAMTILGFLPERFNSFASSFSFGA